MRLSRSKPATSVRRAIAASAILASFGIHSPADAAQAVWDGSTGDWTNGSHWSSNPNYPNNDVTPNNWQAVINSGAVTLNEYISLTSVTQTGGSLLIPTRDPVVGMDVSQPLSFSGTAVGTIQLLAQARAPGLTMTGGRLSVESGVVELNPMPAGTQFLGVIVGVNNVATASITSGADLAITSSAEEGVSASGLYLGLSFTGNGTMLVSGAGSSCSVNGDAVVGVFNRGNLTVNSGALLATDGMSIGHFATGNGTVTIDGPGTQWIDSSGPTEGFAVGYQGNGTLNVTNGATVITSVPSAGTSVARDSAGHGFLNVSGAGSLFQTTALAVGGASTDPNTGTHAGGGSGSVLVSAGGQVRALDYGLELGGETGSSGLVTVTGAGSGLHALRALVGGKDTGPVGQGTVNITSGGTFSCVGTLTVHSGTGTVNVSGAGALAVVGALDNRGKISVGPSGSVLRVNGSFANTGTIDVRASMIVDYPTAGPSPLNAIRGQLATGYAAGAWNGPGINSSAGNASQYGVGYAEASVALGLSGSATATFAGQVVDATSVLVKCTYYGDANLDGRVTFDDYVKIDTGFNQQRTGWVNGDFNYSGTVNFDDYVLIDVNFNQQNGTLTHAIDWISGDNRSAADQDGVQIVIEHFQQFGTTYGAAFLAAVPEPCVIVPVVAPVLALTRRRRRFAPAR